MSPSRATDIRLALPLADLLDSDALPLAVLGVILIEAGLLIAWHRRTQNALRPSFILSFLGAGAALVVALYYHRRAAPAPISFVTALCVALVFQVWHVRQLATRR